MGQLERGVAVAGKYELLEEIGRGGMGSVWRAYAPALGRACALKTLLPSSRSDDERQRLRLFREARIAAKLRSPYVVTVYDVGDWEGTAFIAMELLEGMTLRELLAKAPVPPLEVTLEIMRHLALGLDKAHQASLVHRDLKPDNIFILDHQPLLAKILDFGIAKHLEPLDSAEFQTTTGAISGTPLYMSPEQACGSLVDFRSDLWSLAVIAYECLVGQPPFNGETLFQLMLQIVSQPLPVPSSIRASLPPAFDRWWTRAASRDPERRPESALRLVEGLREAFDGIVGSPQPSAAVSRSRAPARLTLMAAAASVAFAGADYAWSQRASVTDTRAVLRDEPTPPPVPKSIEGKVSRRDVNEADGRAASPRDIAGSERSARRDKSPDDALGNAASQLPERGQAAADVAPEALARGQTAGEVIARKPATLPTRAAVRGDVLLVPSSPRTGAQAALEGATRGPTDHAAPASREAAVRGSPGNDKSAATRGMVAAKTVHGTPAKPQEPSTRDNDDPLGF